MLETERGRTISSIGNDTLASVPEIAPRVTLIIPCFNDGATLEEALESATADQEEAEIVVIDDGSTDPATLETLRRVSAHGIQVVRQQNAGPAAARMAGLHRTRARYVFPLDADDLLVPGALALLADALDANPGISAAWGYLKMFGDVCQVVRTPSVIDPWSQTYVNELPASALFRREALVTAGGWRLTAGYEDWDLWLSLAERGCTGVRVPTVTYRYRIHGERGWHSHRTGRHREIVGELRRLHPALYANRRGSWRSSNAPWRLKLGLPVVSALPLPTRARLALLHALSGPVAVTRAAMGRRRAFAARRLDEVLARRAPAASGTESRRESTPAP